MYYPTHFMLHPTASSSDPILLSPPSHTTAQCLSPGTSQHLLPHRTSVKDTLCRTTRVILSPLSKTPSVSSRTTCPVPYKISGPRCALSYVNYLHGAVTRLMVPPSDASPWVPPDASMELQRYNARKCGIAFSNAPAQGDTKHQDTSSSSSSSSSTSPSTSIPPTLPEFNTPIPPVPSTPSDPLTGSLKCWQAAQPLASDSPYTMPRAQRHRMPQPVGCKWLRGLPTFE